jgi:hypothetical protein
MSKSRNRLRQKAGSLTCPPSGEGGYGEGSYGTREDFGPL